MATRTITRLYDSYDDAAQTVSDLEAAGIPHSDISLLGQGTGTAAGGGYATTDTYDTAGTAGAYTGVTADTPTGAPAMPVDPALDPNAPATGAGTGATVGTVLGGGAGLLAGLGSLAIPGVGPIVAAGWLVATLTGAGVGAGVGGLLGSLTGAGVDEGEAHTYAEGMRRGGTLVSVRVPDDTRGAEVERILAQRSPIDPATRRADYQAAGWSGFDENAGPYVGPAGTATNAGTAVLSGAAGVDPAAGIDPLAPGRSRNQVP
jgi:hypothetical protein